MHLKVYDIRYKVYDIRYMQYDILKICHKY